MTGRRESTELEDRRGSEVMDGSLSRAVGPSQCDGWPQAEDTSLQTQPVPFPTLFQQKKTPRPQKTSLSTSSGHWEPSQKHPSLTEPASRHLKPLGGVKVLSAAPRRAVAGGDGFPWLPSDAWGLPGKASHLWVL